MFGERIHKTLDSGEDRSRSQARDDHCKPTSRLCSDWWRSRWSSLCRSPQGCTGEQRSCQGQACNWSLTCALVIRLSFHARSCPGTTNLADTTKKSTRFCRLLCGNRLLYGNAHVLAHAQVYESLSEYTPQGSGVTLMPNAQYALQAIDTGLFERQAHLHTVLMQHLYLFNLNLIC